MGAAFKEPLSVHVSIAVGLWDAFLKQLLSVLGNFLFPGRAFVNNNIWPFFFFFFVHAFRSDQSSKKSLQPGIFPFEEIGKTGAASKPLGVRRGRPGAGA